MPLKTIIFDLDGTLLNTLEDLADAANSVLEELGQAALPTEDYRYLVGAGARKLISRMLEAAGLPAADEQQLDELLAKYNAAYALNWHAKTRPYPGIRQMLNELRQNQLQLAVFSNKPDAFTQLVIEHFFPDQPFFLVQGQLEGVPLKPDPAALKLICQKLGRAVDEVALVGDSAYDMQAAVRAGVLPLGVLWGFRQKQELVAAGAASLFSQASDLTAYLLTRKE